MLITLAKVLLVIVAILLIIVVLLQSGRSAGLGGAIGGAAEQMMGRKARGIDAVLVRVTTGLATAFILLSIWVTWLVAHSL